MDKIRVTRTYLHLSSPIALRSTALPHGARIVHAHLCPISFFAIAIQDGSFQIAHFGFTPTFLGRGLGKAMLSEAANRAWSLGASRVWLQTCTLDDPAALPN